MKDEFTILDLLYIIVENVQVVGASLKIKQNNVYYTQRTFKRYLFGGGLLCSVLCLWHGTLR